MSYTHSHSFPYKLFPFPPFSPRVIPIPSFPEEWDGIQADSSTPQQGCSSSWGAFSESNTKNDGLNTDGNEINTNNSELNTANSQLSANNNELNSTNNELNTNNVGFKDAKSYFLFLLTPAPGCSIAQHSRISVPSFSFKPQILFVLNLQDIFTTFA